MPQALYRAVLRWLKALCRLVVKALKPVRMACSRVSTAVWAHARSPSVVVRLPLFLREELLEEVLLETEELDELLEEELELLLIEEEELLDELSSARTTIGTSMLPKRSRERERRIERRGKEDAIIPHARRCAPRN